jgi:hypothetical protein
MKSYLTGLRSYCVDMGMDSGDHEMFRHPRVQRVIRGIKMFNGAREGNLRERHPITRDLLLRILTTLDTNTQEGATYHAAFCTAFAGFLRVGEFTWTSAEWLLGAADFSTWHVTRRSVQFLDADSRLYLTLPASRTDPFRMGITITIAAASDAACPVKSLRHLFQRYPLPTFSPLFTLGRNPTGTTAVDSAFTRTKAISRLRAILLELDVSGNYSGQSFRRGTATWARSIGIPDADLQLEYWAAVNLTLTNATLKFTPHTSTMSLAACRPCRRPPRASSPQLPAASHPLGPGPGVFWEELLAASLSHPGKHRRRCMKIEWRNEDGEGGRMVEMEDGVELCLSALVSLVVLWLSAPALVLYLASMSTCWLGSQTR